MKTYKKFITELNKVELAMKAGKLAFKTLKKIGLKSATKKVSVKDIIKFRSNPKNPFTSQMRSAENKTVDTLKKIGKAQRENKTLSNNLEIVVVDDCSTDQTSKILQKFSRKVKIVKHSKNLGLPSALNTGILESSGQFIVRLDADDFILPEYTFMLSTFLKRNKYIDAIKCDYYIVDRLENIVNQNT